MEKSIWDSQGHPITKGDIEGIVNVNGFDLFYEIYGKDGRRGTVLCLHGGPGGTLEDFAPLIALAKSGYKVVMYNQMGSNKSQLPKNKSLLTVEHYVEEVEALRIALDLGKINLVGQSWG